MTFRSLLHAEETNQREDGKVRKEERQENRKRKRERLNRMDDKRGTEKERGGDEDRISRDRITS